MSAVQHSHGSSEWGTPGCVLWRVRALSESDRIDHDPCSSAAFNEYVQAKTFWTFEDGFEGRDCPPGTGLMLVNPPGNAPHEENMPAKVWRWLLEQRARRMFGHAVWVGFTLEHLRSCQAGLGNLVDFPLCIPRDRLEFRRPNGSIGSSPGHANVIAYIPGSRWPQDETTLFYELFGSLGACR